MTPGPFVYEGRIRVFDPVPGEEIYLIDHPDAADGFGPDLVSALSDWRGGERLFLDIPGRFRITVEEVEA